MIHDQTAVAVHPAGDQLPVDPTAPRSAPRSATTLDTFAGPVKVEWGAASALTALGQMPFFIEFLKVSGRFEAWIADCPLERTSPNASLVRDLLGTTMLSMLSGHKRYAHITALRSDPVLPELLGMTKIVSEDAVRNGLKAMPEKEGAEWMQKHIDSCVAPLLGEDYIIDIDTTVKLLYGHQEGAVVGYNPRKPGRPSHVLHTYMLAGPRLVMGVEMAPGNEHTGKHCVPGLWALIDRTPRDCWPRLLRGDSGIGSEGVMREAENHEIDYLFKLRLTANVKRLIKKAFAYSGWRDAGQGWRGLEATLRLDGWSRERRVVILRRKLKDGVVANHGDGHDQLRLSFAEIEGDAEIYEYGVLVTSLDVEVLTLAQLYRDRADCENVFDELKNQWGWAGFTTKDLARCRLAAQMVALFYNWWNLFVRLAEPDKHMEAITSRPLLLSAIGERVRAGRQTTLRIASTHAQAGWARTALDGVARFLRGLIDTAEQLTADQRWSLILSQALKSWLKGRLLRAPPRLMAPA